VSIQQNVLSVFLSGLARTVGSVDGPVLGDPITLLLVDSILHWPIKDPASGGARASERQLAKSIGSHGVLRSDVSLRLRLLAQYGTIKVSHAHDASNVVVVHPELSSRLAGKTAFKRDEMKRFWARSKDLGDERDGCDSDFQGFDSTEPYGGHQSSDEVPATTSKPHLEAPLTGEPESKAKVDPWTQIKAGADSDKKDRQRRERLEWLKLSELFIDGAAKVWTVAQVQKGRPDQMPVWYGPTASLAPTAKRMRQELVKILENEGGKRACLAWYIFCGTTGGTKFDIRVGHRNWATLDKQPSFFAKHFNAITSETEFSAYDQDSEVQEHLKIAFGDVVPQCGPRPR
jgi:hypothetical protein